jgi:hypothetical protein
MNNRSQEQAIRDQIAVQLQVKIWTVETAINILATIQIFKLGDANFNNLCIISKIPDQCAEFIKQGIDIGFLHPVQSKDSLGNLVSSAVGGIGLGSLFSGGGGALAIGATGLGASVAAPAVIVGGVTAAALRFLPTRRKKEKFLQSLLIPAEVAA